MKTITILIGLGLLGPGIVAARADGKYQVTDAERAACQGDAISLCSSAYPDEDAVLACLKRNIAKLTPTCRPVFIAGLRRRGL